MALMGTATTRPTQWLKDHRRALPSIAALLAVTVFWLVGAVGGLSFLHDATSAMAMLSGLYVMLAAVAATIIIAILALSDLVRHFRGERSSR